MTERERLLDMLGRVHDGDAWHGPSVMSVITGVNAREAAARPLQDGHSVQEIARHIAAWRHEVTERLGGKAPSMPAEGDWPGSPAADEAEWKKTLAELDRSHAELRRAIEALPDSRWEEMVGDARDVGFGSGVSVALMLHGLVQHDAYHAGQMALLKKGLR